MVSNHAFQATAGFRLNPRLSSAAAPWQERPRLTRADWGTSSVRVNSEAVGAITRVRDRLRSAVVCGAAAAARGNSRGAVEPPRPFRWPDCCGWSATQPRPEERPERGLHRLCENVAAEVTRRRLLPRNTPDPPPHVGGYLARLEFSHRLFRPQKRVSCEERANFQTLISGSQKAG